MECLTNKLTLNKADVAKPVVPEAKPTPPPPEETIIETGRRSKRKSAQNAELKIRDNQSDDQFIYQRITPKPRQQQHQQKQPVAETQQTAVKSAAAPPPAVKRTAAVKANPKRSSKSDKVRCLYLVLLLFIQMVYGLVWFVSLV